MFDKYMLKKDSVENVIIDGFPIGFRFKVHIGDYRGCFLSLVHGYYITVDGEEFPRDLQKFEINGKAPRTFDEIAKAQWEHWNYDDYATLYVQKPGGLTPGKHRIGLMQGVLMQYGWMPHDQEWIDHTPDPKQLGNKQEEIYYFDVEVK